MATSITSKFLNQDKRENEAVTVTLPAVLNEGGGRTNAAPTYVQGGEAYVASVAPKESITGKAYLLIEEAFPALATVTVTIGGVSIFTAVAATVTGLTVSATEDILLLAGGNIEITVNDIVGDVTTGKAKVIVNYVPYTVKNGRFSETPTV